MVKREYSDSCCKQKRQYLIILCSALILTGCGGQDFGGLQSNLGGDISSGYNSSISNKKSAPDTVSTVIRGVYPMIETSFQLPSVPGDPFDYEKVNVQVTLRRPGGSTVDVPAFFDGGKTWRMRYSPTIPGAYAVVTVKLNREIAHEEKLGTRDWSVKGDPEPGFVRIDRGDHSRFLFDSGARYFPIGHNQAWNSAGIPETTALFDKMHAVGENWSRVWMTHWDGKNLDWPAKGKPDTLGDIDLEAAKKWDAIVATATRDNIYFQMVVQHHGQYSANTDPNWKDNPYNVKNGGFLNTPEDFFTNQQARALTKRKLYYILSRWGYSPNIMAFELFNEVENTDAAKNKLFDNIALWHREMALFLRQYDYNRHLITTSSAPSIPLSSNIWETVDYIQQHTYPSDIVTGVAATENADTKKLSKPIFVGEFGPQSLSDPTGTALHAGLWSGLMHGPSGAAQYWDWENIEKHDLYSQYKGITTFLTASGYAEHGGLVSMSLPVETSQRAALRFGPGGGWGNASNTEFIVGPNGAPPGLDKLPAFIQGQAHRSMMPSPVTFQVSYPQQGTFTVTLGQIAKEGAHVKLSVDGRVVEHDYPGGEKDYTPKAEDQTLRAEVPQGAHTITIENTGKDWAVVKEFALSNYAPALAAEARVGRDYMAAWIYNRANIDNPNDKSATLSPATGKLTVSGMKAGRYRASWWDTQSGKSLDETDIRLANEKATAQLTIPPVTRDIAVYISRLSDRPAKTPVAKRIGLPAGTVAPAVPGTTAPVSTSPGSGAPGSNIPTGATNPSGATGSTTTPPTTNGSTGSTGTTPAPTTPTSK